MPEWQDMIVGERMAVDDAFTTQVDNSQFSRQEWGLIMTAASFEIHQPEDAENARLVADTSDIPAIIPELDAVANMGPLGQPEQDSGGGILESVFASLGLTDDGTESDAERAEAAETLVESYAQDLQAHLEAEGRWTEIRAAAADAESPDS